MKADFSQVNNGIQNIVERWEPILKNIPEKVLSQNKNKQDRTIKQILGHLIDSASNNHQRMVRLQYNQNLVFPDYRQDNDLWISLQQYQSADWHNLIQLWKFYNLHIIQVIESVDKTKLNNYWYDFEGTKVTLNDMIEGYVSHLELHFSEIQELINK